jgi:hypothetical protein
MEKKLFMKRDIFGMKVPYYKADLSKYDLAGFFDPKEQCIVIDESLSGRDLETTILHEEFEAVFSRVAGHQIEITKDAKEIMIETFATFVIENYKPMKRRR